MSRTLYMGWVSDKKRLLVPEDLTTAPAHRKWLGKVDCLLLQCTGEKSIDDEFVFDGDILQFPGDKDHSYVVRWDDKQDGGWGLFLVKGDDPIHVFKSGICSMMAVVGNEHPNPDMLRG